MQIVTDPYMGIVDSGRGEMLFPISTVPQNWFLIRLSDFLRLLSDANFKKKLIVTKRDIVEKSPKIATFSKKEPKNCNI